MSEENRYKGSVIVSYGQTRLGHFSEHMMSAALKSSFKDKPEGALILDSNPRFQEFRAATAAWAVNNGYMEVTRVQDGDQEQVTMLEFTQKGKEEFLAKPAEG